MCGGWAGDRMSDTKVYVYMDAFHHDKKPLNVNHIYITFISVYDVQEFNLLLFFKIHASECS